MIKSVSLRLPSEVSSRLQRLSNLTGRSKTYYMIEAITDHIDDLEDIYVAEQRLADLHAGKSDTVSLEDLMRHHGLEN